MSLFWLSNVKKHSVAMVTRRWCSGVMSCTSLANFPTHDRLLHVLITALPIPLAIKTGIPGLIPGQYG